MAVDVRPPSRKSDKLQSDSELAQVLESYFADLEVGQTPDTEQLIQAHPGIADRLKACFASLRFVEQAVGDSKWQASLSGDDEQSGRLLGDFRTLCEIGRGGMGVVYEAEQLSLGRKVALKVLPFAAVLDSRQLQRFRNESHAAAGLKHPNIVSVYSVGCERDVHFYAMELIEGQNLAQVIDALRRLADKEASKTSPSDELQTGISSDTLPIAALSTETPGGQAAHFRAIARLGIQAADALDYAHSLGVVHRDIKPSNLLLDRDAKLWITDFGLAQVQGESSLTMTGDVLGTLRYMSPEQAAGHRAAIGYRTDIYSLGATLYELLTLHPAFEGDDRQQLLRSILEEEPVPPRQLRAAVPRDLETIVLKAMSKEATGRYGTAQELADDLRRFLDDRPILARRPSLVDSAAKWSRRHLALVMSALGVLLLAVVGLAISAALISHQRNIADEQRAEAIRQRNTARWNLYLADMRVAQQDWKAGQIDHMMSALTRHMPEADAVDLRGWEWHYLTNLCNKARLTLHHRGRVRSVDWSPNGRWLASADYEGQLKIWDPETGHEVCTLKSGNISVGTVRWSPDGARLASGEGDGTIRVWDFQSREEIYSVRTHKEFVNEVTWSPDGNLLASGSDDGTAKIWNAVTGQEIVTLRPTPGIERGPDPVDIFWSVAWSPDGRRLAAGLGPSGWLFIWATEGWKPILTLKIKATQAYSLCWSPDGKWLCGDTFEDITIWDPETGDERSKIVGHTAYPVYCVRWFKDDRIASAGVDGMIKVWEGATGRELRTIRGHKSLVRSVVWNPEGTALASAGPDETIKIWNVDEDQEWLAFDGSLQLSWHPSKPLLAARDSVNLSAVGLFDAATGAKLVSLGGSEGSAEVRSVAMCPDGRHLAAGYTDGVLKVWQVEDGHEILRVPAHDGPIRSVAWSPNGGMIATGGYDRLVRIWDATTGEQLRMFGEFKGFVHSLAWSPDGRRLATAGNAHVVRIWDVFNGVEDLKLQQPFAATDGPGYSLFGRAQFSVAWSSDGAKIAGGSGDGMLFVWDVATGALLYKIQGHAGGVQCVSWSPTGERLATGGPDAMFKIWDAATGSELLAFRFEASTIDSVAWSADGQWLAIVRDNEGKIFHAPGYHPGRQIGDGGGVNAEH